MSIEENERLSNGNWLPVEKIFGEFEFSCADFNFIYFSPALFGQAGRVFANGPEDLGSIPGCVIPKTLKMVLDTSLRDTQHVLD